MPARLDRRTLLRGAGALAAAGLLPGWARSNAPGLMPAPLAGEDIRLTIGHRVWKGGHTIAVNGTVPAPLIRLREGQRVRLTVENRLDEETSIHWHGLLVPFEMDGVPGISFPGIPAGGTFTYDFPVRQAGTYWYHGHSNMQEAMGLYGPLVIDPAGAERAAFDREHVILLSDWSPLHPHAILRKLKQQPGYFNFQKQTLAGQIAGRDQSAAERRHWGQMRMDPTDLSDVTAATYRYHVNGHDTADNWTGLFLPGERVRLRIVNGSAMTNFNVRIPGLAMTVVQADGQDVAPVETDEFQIGVAETYDVIVRPTADRPYGLIAESVDRYGLVRATLSPRPGLAAPVPALRPRPVLTMRDMGMDMTGMEGMHHEMTMLDPMVATHVPRGPGLASVSPMPADRTADRPTGLEQVAHRVLTYAQLRAADPVAAPAVTRTLEVHLTANMERYMWSMDGRKLSERPDPLAFRTGERVRVILINDTMMPHPIHLHGHFFHVVNGSDAPPLKHTVNVLPGAKLAFDLTADAPGDWAFHCHMLMHMHSGMFRVVTVRDA